MDQPPRRETEPSAPEQLLGDLASRTAQGVGWTVFWRLATRGLGLASTLVLAHFLTPADFGLVALATTLVVAVDALSTMGVHDVLIREPQSRRDLYDTAFTLAFFRGLIAAAVLLAIAWPAADFFHESRLTAIFVVLTLGALIDAGENVGVVDFRKYLRFDREFVLLLIPRMIGILVTCIAAVVLRDYRALIIGILSQKISRLIFSYTLHPYRPRLSLKAWRQILSFSVWIWAIAVTSFLRERSDALIVGRMLDPFSLGLFMLSLEIALLPATELVAPLCRVLFSSFAVTRNANGDMQSIFLTSTGIIGAVVLPASVGLALISPPLVPLILGQTWSGAVPLVMVLAPLGIFGAMGALSNTAVVVAGHPNAAFAVNAVVAVIRMGALVAGIHWDGVAGAAWATAASVPLECLLFVLLTRRYLGINVNELIRAMWRSAAATAVMTVTILQFGLLDPAPAPFLSSPTLQVIAIIGFGTVVYAVAHTVLWLLSNRPAGVESFLYERLFRFCHRRFTLSRAKT